MGRTYQIVYGQATPSESRSTNEENAEMKSLGISSHLLADEMSNPRRTHNAPKKRIIVACDGTWMDSDGVEQVPSNVTRIVRAVSCDLSACSKEIDRLTYIDLVCRAGLLYDLSYPNIPGNLLPKRRRYRFE